jgi:dihydroxyacid dehydratase/phosphogluconate dehydratase
MHLLDLGKTVKKAVTDQGMIGWQYNTIGVSDAISMGSEGEWIRRLRRSATMFCERLSDSYSQA